MSRLSRLIFTTASLAVLPLSFARADDAAAGPPAAVIHTVTITARVPEGVGAVYLPGNLPELGPWDPAKFSLSGTGRERTAVLKVPHGTALEFKLALGSWEREGLGPSGTVLPNFKVLVDSDKQVPVEIVDFKRDPAEYLADVEGSGVLGTLIYWKDVSSSRLELPRHVSIWLPPGYHADPEARYPVLYMHDGQNLFDPRIANTGVDWGVDEAIVRGVEEGRLRPAIVVATWSTANRLREYSPWDLGPAYARFLIEEVMPRVNREFRTRTGPENTSVMGSSMGGLISFHLVRRHPEVFGSAGCVSTHWPWNGDRTLGSSAPPLIERELAGPAGVSKETRIYFDFGTQGIDARYEPLQTKVNAWLRAGGLEEGKHFVVRKFEGADHNEAAWRARLDEPLAFLLSPRTER